MALLFVDSFDNYNSMTIAELGKWQTYVQGTNMVMSIAAGFGRNGGAALKIPVVTSTDTYLQRVLPGGALARVVMGFAVNVTVFEPTVEIPLFQFVDINTGQVCVTLLPNGQMRFRSGTLGGAILSTSTGSVIDATNVYFYLEFDITFNGATGALVLHKNGVNVPLSASSGLNTAPSGNNSFNTYRVGTASGGALFATSTIYIDDHYYLSTSGGVETGFLGDSKAVVFFPNGAGSSTQFTPNGAGTNWECVNQTSEDGDTTYVSDATPGDKDLYTLQDSPANTGTIFGIQLCSVWRKDDAGSRTAANTIKSGTTTLDGATIAISETYAWGLDIVEQDPNTSSAWTKTTLDALEAGVKVVS